MTLGTLSNREMRSFHLISNQVMMTDTVVDVEAEVEVDMIGTKYCSLLFFSLLPIRFVA